MAKRGWSLTDAQLERRKQNPAARSAQAPRSQKRSVKPKPVSRPSPARIAERSGTFSDGLSRYRSYNEMTYGKPDVASLGDPMSGWGDGVKAQHRAKSPEWRGGSGNYDDPTVPTRSMAGGRPRIDGGSDAVDNSKRRQASTQAAYRAADASMFNSNVTPKAERVENKRPRSRMSPDQNVFW